MPDVRLMFDDQYLYCHHLQKREHIIKIKKVVKGKIQGKKTVPMVYFDSAGSLPDLPLGLNKTNCNTIIGLYGSEPAQWAGKFITLYPTTTTMDKSTVDCIRVRPEIPDVAGAERPAKAAPSDTNGDAS